MATYRFNVNFDANSSQKVTISPNNVEVAAEEINLIIFTLSGPANAKFPSTPIQWLQDSEPVNLPPWFVMHRHNAEHFSLWDFNSTPETIGHHFQVSVFYDIDGQTYSTDPVIVNEAPSG